MQIIFKKKIKLLRKFSRIKIIISTTSKIKFVQLWIMQPSNNSLMIITPYATSDSSNHEFTYNLTRKFPSLPMSQSNLPRFTAKCATSSPDSKLSLETCRACNWRFCELRNLRNRSECCGFWNYRRCASNFENIMQPFRQPLTERAALRRFWTMANKRSFIFW